MEALKDLNNIMNQLQNTATQAFNQAMTPEVLAQMTEEQKTMVDQGRNAFKFNGLTVDEKMEQLQKTLKDVANVNK